mmetsp:Transcript_9127/g.41516  ORF Transcript_9127/g.41516 Transcript_9127/m.41516 type:complete len:278 (-) Transcript_9127:1261-2094(-)
MTSRRAGDTMSVETHRAELVDQSLPMPRRFRALFTLRSIGGDDAIAALLGSLEDPSALFRHEVAFALGQMQAPGAVETLKRVLRDTGDDEMVRHECAEALGAIATEECLDALREACEDGTQVVRETAKLALQRLEHAREKRGEAPAADATAGMIRAMTSLESASKSARSCTVTTGGTRLTTCTFGGACCVGGRACCASMASVARAGAGVGAGLIAPGTLTLIAASDVNPLPRILASTNDVGADVGGGTSPGSGSASRANGACAVRSAPAPWHVSHKS